MEGWDLTPCLRPFIKELAPIYQEAILKTSFEGMSQKEYAKELGLSYAGTKSRVQRARLKLKELFISCCQIETDSYGNVVDLKKGCKC